MINKQEFKYCTPEQLYLKMLEIGSECISCGIKYADLKSKLCSQGLIESTESDEIIKILFENSFTDRNSTCLKPYYEEEKPCDSKYDKENDEHFKYNHLENCVHYLTNEALMNLLHLRESINNRKTTINAKWLSFASLGTALLILISNLTKPNFTEVFDTTEYKQLKSELPRSISNINLSLVELYQLDSVNQVNDSLQIANLLGKTNLENLQQNLKTLNYNIYKLNKSLNEQNENE